MALIVHRCTKCNRTSLQHEYGLGCATPSFGPPEVVATYDAFGAPVTDIVEPGTKWFGFGMKALELCDCAACKALYAGRVTA